MIPTLMLADGRISRPIPSQSLLIRSMIPTMIGLAILIQAGVPVAIPSNQVNDSYSIGCNSPVGARGLVAIPSNQVNDSYDERSSEDVVARIGVAIPSNQVNDSYLVRERMLRDQFTKSQSLLIRSMIPTALPTPPRSPGWHRRNPF